MIGKLTQLLAVAALGFTAGGAVAQDSESRVAANTAWSVFVEENPKECWSVSAPNKIVNTRGGKEVKAKRGEILLFVSFRPGDGGPGQVAFTGGYPFAKQGQVSLTIGSSEFTLFTEGEWAWTQSPEDDAAIIAAMKTGATAVLVGQSTRGTRTEDSFSLLGFTAAVEDASRRCQ
ncbi:MAG: hypothetical protein CSA74_05620 [Rhodobacterales bacterium]|nr:MAG: hypothetical protein CSA74_05620 [Rhodobacterales bacterium]